MPPSPPRTRASPSSPIRARRNPRRRSLGRTCSPSCPKSLSSPAALGPGPPKFPSRRTGPSPATMRTPMPGIRGTAMMPPCTSAISAAGSALLWSRGPASILWSWNLSTCTIPRATRSSGIRCAMSAPTPMVWTTPRRSCSTAPGPNWPTCRSIFSCGPIRAPRKK